MSTTAQIAPAIDWSARARWLAVATMAYNALEGVVSMGFGVSEGSIALLGFGVDSWVEVGSAGVVYWKLTRAPGCATTARERERVATRWIGRLFLVLAVGTALGAVAQIASARHPESTLPGVVISLLSLSFMVYLWRAKLAAATALNSRALAMDAACSRACIQLSGVLLAGSAIYTLAPALWWADAAAALALSALIGREGYEAVQSANKKEFSGGCGCSG